MGRAKKKKEFTVRVNDAKFEIKRDGSSGQMIIEYAKYDDMGERIGNEIIERVDITNCWVDDKTNNCIKAYCRTDPKKVSHARLVSSLIYSGISLCPEGQCLTAERIGPSAVIRYGTKPGYQYNGYSGGEYYNVYDSKEYLLREMIQKVSATRQVAGIEMISLSIVKSKILAQLGFDAVRDCIGNGVIMWRGDADDVLSPGGRYLGYSAKEKSANSFLRLLSEHLK